MTKMRVARYYGNADVKVEQMERPSLVDGEVLLRVMASGICGSDVMEWFRLPKAPRVLGHEIVGVVAESRSPVRQRGEIVVVRNQVPCRRCYACTRGYSAVCEETVEIEPGGMAEYIRVPARVVMDGLWTLPITVPYHLAPLVEPTACVLHAQRRAMLRAGDAVVVVGCGVFGLLHIQLAKRAGARCIVAIEPSSTRRARALELGASAAFRPDEDSLEARLKDLNGGRLADLAIVATGAPDALPLAERSIGRLGTILLFAVPSPTSSGHLGLNHLFWRREISLVSTYGPGDVSFGDAISLIANGAIDAESLVTDRIPLSDALAGFQKVARADKSLKVVIDLERER